MLSVQQLEDRSAPSASPALVDPAALGADWGVPVQRLPGYFSGAVLPDTVAVAEAGGACRVEVVSPDGAVELNTILFDPVHFRGGGRAAVIPGTSEPHVLGQTYPPDELLVVPGQGGGPVVTRFGFDAAAGALAITDSFFAPYPTDLRCGLQVSEGSLTLGGRPDVFFLPGPGGAAEFVAYNLATGRTDAAFFVADPADRSGDWAFTPEGGTVQTPDMQAMAVPVLYPAEAVGPGEVKTRLWGLPAGEDLTAAYGGPWVG